MAAALGKTAAQLESWRCKSPAAFGWIDWARSKGLAVFDDSSRHTIQTVYTIEANTGPAGGRDGDGVWRKTRASNLAKAFVRLLE